MKKFTFIRLAVSIFTIIFLSSTILFYVNSSRNLFFIHSEFSLRHLAQEKANSIESVINYAEGSIQLLSNFVSTQMTEKELKNPNQVFSRYKKQLPFDLVEYIRWDGLNFMNSVAGSNPFDASKRPYYIEGIKGNSGIWANFTPKVSKEVLLNFYTPLYYNGEISGVITGAVGETSSLKQKLTASFFGHQIQSFICDENFIVISSACEGLNPGLDLKNWTSIKLLSDIMEHSNENDLTPFKYEISGKYGLCCTSTIKSNGWHVVMIVYPTVLNAVEKEVSGNIFLISILIIIILVIYLAVSLWLQAKTHLMIQGKLLFAATRDELTGLYNRHAYESDLRKLDPDNLDKNFTYVAFDVNGLKNANDNFGHEAGDELIKAAAKYIDKCFGKYGKTYRTGGDEFIAILNATEEEMASTREQFIKITGEWKGQFTSTLKIPAGIVTRNEHPDLSIHDMTKIADQRMYKEKSLIYLASGIDRRAQSAAYEVLCRSYTKILKVNLTNDDFIIIQMDSDEKTSTKGYNESISTWLHDFGTSGQVHKDDVESYLSKTSLEFMRHHFASGKTELNIFYRRKIGDRFCKVLMEMKPAKDYSHDEQKIFLYVKNIDKE